MEEQIKEIVTCIQANQSANLFIGQEAYTIFNASTERLFSIDEKNRLVLLLPEIIDVLQYCAAPEPELFDTENDTIFIIDNCIGINENALQKNQSIKAMVVKEDLIYAILKRLRTPVLALTTTI